MINQGYPKGNEWTFMSAITVCAGLQRNLPDEQPRWKSITSIDILAIEDTHG
jgi:hypothetical protein